MGIFIFIAIGVMALAVYQNRKDKIKIGGIYRHINSHKLVTVIDFSKDVVLFATDTDEYVHCSSALNFVQEYEEF